MRQLKTEAVILDASELFEADRLFLLFTRELGKIRARAKGVRRPTSRLTGHLLSYLPTQLELVESKTAGFWLIIQAQVLPNYVEGATYPADTLLFLGQAGIIAEALNRLFIDREPHPQIYAGLIYTLDRLRALCEKEAEPGRAELVTAEFLLKSLVELGYRPQLERCALTGEALKELFIGWSSQIGGVLSQNGYERADGDRIRLDSSRTVVLLRELCRPEFVAERLQLNPEVQKEALPVIYNYLQSQIGEGLQSLTSGKTDS